MSKTTKAIKKALPTVFTVLSGVATVAAVVLAAKEGPKYQKILEEKGEMSKKEKVLTAAKTFTPAAACAAVSIASTVGAHCMDLHTQASLTGAYVALQEAYKKYQKTNIELNGDEADTKVLTAIEEEKLPETVRGADGEKVYNVCLCGLSETVPEVYFTSTKEELLKNIIHVNKILSMEFALNVNDFLEIFGLPKVEDGSNAGWSTDMLCDWDGGNLWLDIEVEEDKDGSLLVYPIYSAYEGYLSDYGLDY